MERRTKIVCTLGPATSDYETIRALIKAGMNVARLNFSHGEHADHAANITHVRKAAKELGKTVSILQDLQGPKIRIGMVKGGGVLLKQGQQLILTSEKLEESTTEKVFVSYAGLSDDLSVGGRILIDDGLLELKVRQIQDDEVITEVLVGGPLRSRKGVNLPDIRTSTPSLTEKDRRDLEFGLSQDVDFVALSFVRDQSDVVRLLDRIDDSGKETNVIAKIEKPEAVRNIDRIMRKADGIMVARGDLGIEMPMSHVPRAQKTLIQRSLQAAKPVITATQMLESMIENPRPTRAEASDVANAVLDGSDAVMLSGETAVGQYPVRVVETMAEIIFEAERYQEQYRMTVQPAAGRATSSQDVTESISYQACQVAEQVHADAIACLTASGTTARMIARHRPDSPIYAFTDNERVVRRLNLLWGTQAFHIPFQDDTDEGVAAVHRILNNYGSVKPGSLVVITAGMPLPAKGRTNMVHVSRV